MAIHQLAMLIVVWLLLITNYPAQTDTSHQELVPKVDEYINALVKLGWFRGSILIAIDSKELVSKGYGMANLEHNVPNTPQTKFRLASVTKQFTAMAILMLQQQGKLNVHDPVCKYVLDCPKAWDGVSIHHLLTHTSGIPDFVDFLSLEARRLPSPIASTIAVFKDKPLNCKPGEKFSYSNSGYILLGYIIEKVSGKTYELFLAENIFHPLKMMDTGYDYSSSILKHRAAGYYFEGDTLVNAPYLDLSRAHAAGALYSTIKDLFRWDQALYTEKLVSKNSLDAMFTPFKENHGYGWYISTQFNHRVIRHSGGIEGFASHIARYPDDKVSIIVLSNLSVAPAFKISRDLAAIVFGEKYDVPKEGQVIKVDPPIYEAYVGQYEMAPNNIVTITKEGDRLMMQFSGRPKVELFPESETEFFRKVVDLPITFVKNEKGRVSQMTLHVDGEDIRAKKIK